MLHEISFTLDIVMKWRIVIRKTANQMNDLKKIIKKLSHQSWIFSSNSVFNNNLSATYVWSDITRDLLIQANNWHFHSTPADFMLQSLAKDTYISNSYSQKHHHFYLLHANDWVHCTLHRFVGEKRYHWSIVMRHDMTWYISFVFNLMYYR